MKLDWNRLPPGLRNREAKRIAAATGIGLLIATAYVLLAPNWYESTLTVVPSGSSKGAALGGQIVGALGGIELPGDLSGNADIERIAAVRESRRVRDAIIKRFDLTI